MCSDFMSRSSGMGFGGLLIGVGIGYVAIRYLKFSIDISAVLLIIIGIGIIASSILFRNQYRYLREITGGVIGGLFLAIIFTGAFNFINPFPFGNTITGSGDIITQTYGIQDFSSIETGYGFGLEVAQSDEYSISVSFDDNVEDKLLVVKEGDTLKIELEQGSYSNMNLRATITMPRLDSMEFSGGSHGDVTGFSSENDFRLDLSGGSWVTIVGSTGDLTIDASGGSRLFLSEFTAEMVDVKMSGGSNGAIYASGRLDADLSGGSHLDYYGNPELGDIDTTSSSSIIPK